MTIVTVKECERCPLQPIQPTRKRSRRHRRTRMTPDELLNLGRPAPPCGISGRRTWGLPQPSDSLIRQRAPSFSLINVRAPPASRACTTRSIRLVPGSSRSAYRPAVWTRWDEIAFGEYDHLTRYLNERRKESNHEQRIEKERRHHRTVP